MFPFKGLDCHFCFSVRSLWLTHIFKSVQFYHTEIYPEPFCKILQPSTCCLLPSKFLLHICFPSFFLYSIFYFLIFLWITHFIRFNDCCLSWSAEYNPLKSRYLHHCCYLIYPRYLESCFLSWYSYNSYHRLGNLNYKHLFLTVLEERQFKIMKLEDLVSGKDSLPDL